MTSHDVVARLRRLTKIKQIGHTGTLDPFATGVLPICIGKATRLIEYLEDDKTYIATVKFGANTDTYDLEGEVTATFDKKISCDEINSILPSFRGEIEQLPPIYSAIKVGGKKLYEYARKGEEVEIQPRRVNIYELALVNFDEAAQTAQLAVKCSKGTYIRSLAYDIGKVLGCGAHLIALERTQAGKFKIENSVKLENLDIATNLINPLEVLSQAQINVNSTELTKIKNGVAFHHVGTPDGTVLLVHENNICAVGFSEDNLISLKKVFL